MMTIVNPRIFQRLVTAIATAGLALAACDSGKTDEGTEGSSLEIAGFALTEDDQSDDGFNASAETAPLEAAIPEDLDSDSGEVPPSDETDPPASEGPDRIVRTVLVVWGQPKLNPALEGTPTAWVGSIKSDKAGFKVLRAVQFEREAQGDHLVRDEDPKSVSFSTTTTTFHDGLLLRVVMPKEVGTLGGELVFETEHFTKTVPLRAILAGEQLTFKADDLGNGLLIASAPPSRCAHGVARLHWERKNERGGIFGGRIYGDDGAIRGKVVGIWGTVGGKNRFKGVYRDETGAFKGTVRGAWRAFPDAAGEDGGVFRGVWSTADGAVHGVIGGVVRVGDEAGQGSAHGFWRALCGAPGNGPACDGELALPEPPAPDCSCGEDEENAMEACSCDVPPPVSACVPSEEPTATE